MPDDPRPHRFRTAKLRLRALKAPKLPPKVKAKVKQGMGKLRRFALARMKESYISRMLQRREGECRRCGLCCRLLFECPFLQSLPDGTSRCRIHARRPANCKFFPIDERDLRDRDSLGAQAPCGFKFRKE
ncbi:MAG TPA: hypothetical protein DEB40_12330 [Elusimicrobia bacterium]|nr:hypothetical protein [Elusimicrobiota bacterium]HBT62521.1 hypothetical protein [Elusimicrobiota bacterium]